jgi:hypothetical protein
MKPPFSLCGPSDIPKLRRTRLSRRYHEDVDWVYHQADAVLSPQAVARQVANLRRAHIAFRDTVPADNPPLDSPCNF